MKIRNKKTDEIIEVQNNAVTVWRTYGDNPSYGSLAELNDEWEDYKPKEPLIKDERIRKTVKAWAEANELEPDFEVRYCENTFSLISWQASIDFNTQIKGLEHNKKYTINELCGEE